MSLIVAYHLADSQPSLDESLLNRNNTPKQILITEICRGVNKTREQLAFLKLRMSILLPILYTEGEFPKIQEQHRAKGETSFKIYKN